VITLPDKTEDDRNIVTRFVSGVFHPVNWLQNLTGADPIYPILILFGLNAADELDRTAFGVLAPNIQQAFGLEISGILNLIGVVTAVALLLQIPIAHFADRAPRVRIILIGASLWAMFSVGTGLAVGIVMLGLMRVGSGLGRSVESTQYSLIADYYSVESRPRVYSFHRGANSVGQFIGPLFGGLLASWGIAHFGAEIGWRLPFFVFAIPTLVLVVLGLRLREPVRGAPERRAMGASTAAIATEEQPASFEEACRMIFKVGTLRRIFISLPFIAASLIGFLSLASLKYQSLGLDEAGRGLATAITEPFQLVGLYIGARIGTKLIRRDPSLVLKFLSVNAFVAATFATGFALAPTVWLAVIMGIGIATTLAVVGPGVLATLSLVIPPRARSVGFSMGAAFVLPGLISFPIIGAIADTFGISIGLVLMGPIFLIGGLIISSASTSVKSDMKDVWTSATTRSEMLNDRREGRSKLLLVRGLDVRYGDVRILFDVDFEIDQGEIVALLGTNGAGKSTLLRAICGVVEAQNGAIVFDGRDIAHAPPHQVAELGISMVPGGAGVFPTLTVQENLNVASWIERKRARKTSGAALDAKMEEVLDTFPILRQRLDDPAADLSGGQQQMLGLGMAFLSEPKLLMIDELSLGLAPVVVAQLLEIVKKIRDQGTTIILVEQSVNVALTLAETAYFMEKGEIRFHGLTSELLARPDMLRSVFLEGAHAGMNAAGKTAVGYGTGARTDTIEMTDSVGPNGPNGPSGRDGHNRFEGRNGGLDGRDGDDGSNGRSAERISEPELVGVGAISAGAVVPRANGSGVPALEIEGLSVRFGGIRAVDRVSLSVAPGEIVGIIGPNGAGKTTLFDLVSGFTRADSGRIRLAGKDLIGRGPDHRARLGLGRSFQDARLFPALTVEETIAVALERFVAVKDPFNAVMRLPAQQDSEHALHRRVDELIEMMGIESFRSKFVRELSTGSRRVVDLACVLAHRPTVVLLDEPSSGIAQREAEALGPLIQRIRANLGASILLIEHDMPLVTGVSDRLLALDQGQVIAMGTSDEVLNDPEVVASYLGDSRVAITRSGTTEP
jgi:ABC-type branched-subunit amino acid transport system ATPase component/MFS family permease